MINILEKIAELAIEVGPKEGSWRPDYDDLERFLEEVSELIPVEVWEQIEGNVKVSPNACPTCHGNGFIQQYSMDEADYGRTWMEDCACVVKYEAQLEEQYQAHLAEKSKESGRSVGTEEVDVEKVD